VDGVENDGWVSVVGVENKVVVVADDCTVVDNDFVYRKDWEESGN
jgi:hypothetical protein